MSGGIAAQDKFTKTGGCTPRVMMQPAWQPLQPLVSSRPWHQQRLYPPLPLRRPPAQQQQQQQRLFCLCLSFLLSACCQTRSALWSPPQRQRQRRFWRVLDVTALPLFLLICLTPWRQLQRCWHLHCHLLRRALRPLLCVCLSLAPSNRVAHKQGGGVRQRRARKGQLLKKTKSEKDNNFAQAKRK